MATTRCLPGVHLGRKLDQKENRGRDLNPRNSKMGCSSSAHCARKAAPANACVVVCRASQGRREAGPCMRVLARPEWTGAGQGGRSLLLVLESEGPGLLGRGGPACVLDSGRKWLLQEAVLGLGTQQNAKGGSPTTGEGPPEAESSLSLWELGGCGQWWWQARCRSGIRSGQPPPHT